MTEFSELDTARWFWAMAQTAALSLAEATFRPVLTRFWVVISWDSVALRFCSATIAPTLVLTLNDIVRSFSKVATAVLAAKGVLPRVRRQQVTGQLNPRAATP